jgi:hypothetical protein
MKDKKFIASELRHAIVYYAELAINEHEYQETTPEADKAWEDINNLIQQLMEA